MSQLSEHIGKRIKLYRKNKQLTQAQLAQMVHHSKSAISKYECGEIAIDIETLYQLADALDINIQQLLDFNAQKAFPMPGLQGFFHSPSRFYTYYLGIRSTRVIRGVLEINRTDDNEYSSILFSDVKDFDNLYHCGHLYFGDIHYSDSYVNMLLENQSNRAERIFFNVANPFNNNAMMTVGMLCGISDKYMVPIGLKTILSKSRLPEDAALREALRFTKDDFNSMKKTFCFSISRFVEL